VTEKFNPYATLGVSSNATEDEITAAYRREAQKAHPDREGGSVERMTDINMAYKILGDPAMRAEFDRTGGVAPKNALLDKAREHLVGMVKTLIRGSAPTANLIELLRDGIAKQRLGCQESRFRTQSDLALLRDRLRRLKGPPGNFIEGVILQEISRGEEHLPTYDADEEVLKKAAEILLEYSYQTDAASTVNAALLQLGSAAQSPPYGVFCGPGGASRY
jgi:curved DNA-binding protein CbpA